jgi:cysteine desulfurase
VGAVYLDNNATTRVDPAVVAAMLPYFTERFGNPSSHHGPGEEAAFGLEQARDQLRALVGAQHAQEIVFTSGGTEASTTALVSVVQAALAAQPGRDQLVTTAVEHPAVLAVCRHLQETRGVQVHLIGVDGRGRLDEEAFARALGPRTALASVMWANNETGTLFPVERLARLAHEAGALFHTDAVQAVGKIPVDVAAAKVDLLSLSGHKLHGPKGTGALYVRKGLRLTPLLRGGRQERGRRAGTENVPGIVGLGAAAALAAPFLRAAGERVALLRDRLEQGLLARVAGCAVNGDSSARLPNTCNLAFEGCEGEALLHALGREGIAAASGAACSSGAVEPSHVLRAMKVPPARLYGAVRFSLSRETSAAEIDRVLEVLPPLVQRLRAPAPGAQATPQRAAAAAQP